MVDKKGLRRGLKRAILLFTLYGCVGSAHAADRLELDEISIRGAKELPKVLYIVPWKNSRLSTIDATLEQGTFDSAMVPLDRYTFRREIKYHDLLQGESEGVSQKN